MVDTPTQGHARVDRRTLDFELLPCHRGRRVYWEGQVRDVRGERSVRFALLTFGNADRERKAHVTTLWAPTAKGRVEYLSFTMRR